jgi:hypothetical protein
MIFCGYVQLLNGRQMLSNFQVSANFISWFRDIEKIDFAVVKLVMLIEWVGSGD